MDYAARTNRVKKEIDWKRYDAILISSNSTVIYLTGYSNFTPHERDAYLLLTPKSNYLITDGRYSEAVKKQVLHFITLVRGAKKRISDLIEEIIKKENLISLGIEESDLAVSEYKFFKKYFKKIKAFDPSTIRILKDKEEVTSIEKACSLADKALESTIKLLKQNISEIEISTAFELYLRQNQSESSFPTIIGFDENAAIPHHQTGQTKLKKKSGSFVLVDCGAKLENYCSDMTRTFFYGTPDEKQTKIYNAVLDAQTKAAEFIDQRIKTKKSVKESEVDQVARDVITSHGFEPYAHALGHGTGLDVHEPPVLSLRANGELKVGMVFSIEPGIYIPEYGGVRIEDLYVIEKTGLRQLTQFPKDLTII